MRFGIVFVTEGFIEEVYFGWVCFDVLFWFGIIRDSEGMGVSFLKVKFKSFFKIVEIVVHKETLSAAQTPRLTISL